MFNWLKSIFTRAGNPFDNPAIPLSEGLALGWTRPSPSGFSVTPHTVMSIPSVKRAVQLVAGHIARLDLCGFRIGRNGSRDEASDHPAYDLLHWRPSPLYSSVDWKQAAMVDVLLRGNHFSWILRDDNAGPQELLRLDPDAVTPQVAGNDMVYRVRLGQGEEKYLVASDVLHFKGLGNGLVGQSIVDNMLDSLGLAGALQRFSSVYFANNCAPGMLFEYTNPPSQGKEGKDALRGNLERLHMGLDKSHRVGVIPWGLKLVNYTIDAEKAQLLQSRQFTLIDVANAIGISAQKLGAQISTNYNSLESERKAFLEDLEIYLCSIEEEINYKLLTESEKRLGRTYFEFDRSSMEKPDADTEEKIWTDRLNNGKCTFNEYRAATNQSTSDEDWADLHRMPANIIYAEQAAEEPEPQPPPVIPPVPSIAPPTDDQEPAQPAPDERLRSLVNLDVDRLVTRLRKASEGKPDDWFASEDFLTHRDVCVKSLPWGLSLIDDFLSDVIESRGIGDHKVFQLKEALCRI